MTPSEYEAEVERELLRCYPGSTAQRNVKLDGRLSGVRRQIDVLLTVPGLGEVVVEAKRYGRKVHVKDVESFIGMLGDVGAERGLMVAPLGFTPGAEQRAWRGGESLELDALSLEGLRRFQAAGGIPYAGSCGAIVTAPFGWVLDADTGFASEFSSAVLYRHGRTLDEAVTAGEWMYVEFWNRDDPEVRTLPALLRRQGAAMREFYGHVSITYPDAPPFEDRRMAKRRVELPSGGVELTGFVELDACIVYLVMFTPREAESKNTRKLDYAISELRPLRVSHPDTRSEKDSVDGHG